MQTVKQRQHGTGKLLHFSGELSHFLGNATLGFDALTSGLMVCYS